MYKRVQACFNLIDYHYHRLINFPSDYYLVMSKRVLSRLCLYWLPRYLLDLRMKDLSKDRTFSNEKFQSEMRKVSDKDLHQQIFKTTSLQSIPTSSLSDLHITKMLSLDGSSFNEIKVTGSVLNQEVSLESEFEVRITRRLTTEKFILFRLK